MGGRRGGSPHALSYVPRGVVAQIVPNLGEKREESSGRQCTKRSAVTACLSSGYHRKFSAISHLQKRVAPNSNPCLPAIRLAFISPPASRRLAHGEPVSGRMSRRSSRERERRRTVPFSASAARVFLTRLRRDVSTKSAWRTKAGPDSRHPLSPSARLARGYGWQAASRERHQRVSVVARSAKVDAHQLRNHPSQPATSVASLLRGCSACFQARTGAPCIARCEQNV